MRQKQTPYSPSAINIYNTLPMPCGSVCSPPPGPYSLSCAAIHCPAVTVPCTALPRGPVVVYCKPPCLTRCRVLQARWRTPPCPAAALSCTAQYSPSPAKPHPAIHRCIAVRCGRRNSLMAYCGTGRAGSGWSTSPAHHGSPGTRQPQGSVNSQCACPSSPRQQGVGK